jgi:hypothetical protein
MWVITLTLIEVLYVLILLLIHFLYKVCQLLSQYFHFHTHTAKEKCTIQRTVMRDIKNTENGNERHQKYRER